MNSGKVYLLKIVTADKTFFKIGYTGGSVSERVKSLQTGCPFKISIEDVYVTDNARKIEKSLHNISRHKRMHGEWFELDLDEAFDFRKKCEKYDNVYLVIEKNNEM